MLRAANGCWERLPSAIGTPRPFWPGFDTTGDCGGQTGGGCLLVDREKGAYYARQLAAALRSGRKSIAIETWNEFDEGTGVGATVEFGRTYIDLTRKYADAFHAGRRTLA